MAVSAVWKLLNLLAPYPSEPWYPLPYTGGTPVPLSKSPKGIGFWYQKASVSASLSAGAAVSHPLAGRW